MCTKRVRLHVPSVSYVVSNNWYAGLLDRSCHCSTLSVLCHTNVCRITICPVTQHIMRLKFAAHFAASGSCAHTVNAFHDLSSR